MFGSLIEETVTYERLVNTGNYENQRFSVTLIIKPGQEYEEVFAKAQRIVENEVNRLLTKGLS